MFCDDDDADDDDDGNHHIRHPHRHHFCLLLSADTRNLICMSKQYKPTRNVKYTKQNVKCKTVAVNKFFHIDYRLRSLSRSNQQF